MVAEGRVDGQGVRCFFHHWKFAEDGKCVDVPCQKTPVKAGIRTWPAEEKYGMIDTLSYVIKPDNGDIFQKDVLKLISELTDVSWQTPYSSRVSSLTNHQYTTVNGDDININDFIEDVDSLNSSQIIKLKEQALKEKTIVNFILSESRKVSFVNINLDVPIGVGFDESINFAEAQKKNI